MNGSKWLMGTGYNCSYNWGVRIVGGPRGSSPVLVVDQRMKRWHVLVAYWLSIWEIDQGAVWLG